MTEEMNIQISQSDSSNFSSLPVEILAHIFQYLDLEQVSNLLIISKRFWSLFSNKFFWFSLCKLIRHDIPLKSNFNWRQVYGDLTLGYLWEKTHSIEEIEYLDKFSIGKLKSLPRTSRYLTLIAKRPLLSSQRYEFSVQFFWKEDGGSKSVRMIGIISEEMKKKKKGFYESLGSSSQSYGFTSEGRKTNWNFDSIYDRSKIGFNSGDVIITIFDHGTLSFMVNGIDKGVAFKGISGRFYPAATLSCIEDTIHIFGEFERLSF